MSSDSHPIVNRRLNWLYSNFHHRFHRYRIWHFAYRPLKHFLRFNFDRISTINWMNSLNFCWKRVRFQFFWTPLSFNNDECIRFLSQFLCTQRFFFAEQTFSAEQIFIKEKKMHRLWNDVQRASAVLVNHTSGLSFGRNERNQRSTEIFPIILS